MVIRESKTKCTLIGGLAVFLLAALNAAAQTQDTAPSSTTTEKAAGKKDKPVPPPRRARDTQKSDAGEGPRLDVPVSFPADI
jgi:hypothetical protein